MENVNEINDSCIYDLDKENDIFGIDLGTSNCCIALWKNGTYTIVKDKYENRTIPSIVGVTEDEIYVGSEVMLQKNIKSENIISGIKRLIGKKYDEIINIKNNFTYKIESDENNNIVVCGNIKNNKNKFYPEEITAYILHEIKNCICEYIKISIYDMPIIKVVVTIPAYFNDLQRQSTCDAIKIAGFECLKILNEPTAAAMAYGYEKRYENNGIEHIIMVYDMGGGTTDVSILNICDGVFEVLASTGDTLLGGIDFDNILIDYCLKIFGKEMDDIELDKICILKNKCEETKKKISFEDNLIIFIENFYENIDLNITITQTIFYFLSEKILQKSIGPIINALESCELKCEDINDVIMIGGATKLKILRNKISKLFNKDPICNINPDEVVAIGAAIQGFILTKKTDPFTNNIVLLDITPLSLGVEVMGGIMDIVIKRNTIIPITKRKKYTNDTDNETSIKIKIFEGERQMTINNMFMGEIILNNLSPVPRGCADIDVIFKIDINGMISVTAHELNNNIIQNVDITLNKGRLSKDQIDKIIEESVLSKNKDEIEKKKKQLYYNIFEYISTIKKNLNSIDLKIDDNKKKIFENELNEMEIFINENLYDDVLMDTYAEMLLKIENVFGNLTLRSCDEYETSILSYNDDYLNEKKINNIENCTSDSNPDLLCGENTSHNECTNLDEITNEFLNTCNEILESCENNTFSYEVCENIKCYINEFLCWFYTENTNKNMDYDEIKKMILQIKKYYCSIIDKNNILLDDINEPKNELLITCTTLIEYFDSIDIKIFKTWEEKLNYSFLKHFIYHIISIYDNINDEKIIKNIMDIITFFSNKLFNYLF